MTDIPQEFLLAVKNIGTDPTREEVLNQYKAENANLTVQCFVVLLKNPDKDIRGSSAVLLRSFVNPQAKNNCWEALPENIKADLKLTLIQSLQLEPEGHIRHKLISIVNAIGADLLVKRQWPELFPFLLSVIHDPNENLRETAFMIIGALSNEIIQITESANATVFKNLVQKGLEDRALSVQIAALGTVSNFIDISPNFADEFKSLIGPMLKVIDNAIAQNSEKQARSGIITLILIVEVKAVFIKNLFDQIYRQFMGYITSDMAEPETKSHCLEFFITVAERRCSLLKAKPEYFQTLVAVLLDWISTLETADDDIKEWATGGQLEEDSGSLFSYGADSLDRFSIYAGKAIFPVIAQHLGSMATSPQWTKKFAALSAITYISEGCKDQIKKSIKDILALIAPLTGDQHPRVRHNAYVALSQIATDVGPKLHHQIPLLVPFALRTMREDPIPKVQQQACVFLSDFLEDAAKTALKDYQESLIDSLYTLLQSPHIFVAQSALNAFSTIIECIGEAFTPLYERVMQTLFGILKLPNTVENRNFRGRAIEAISLIGVAVGKDKFKADCFSILQYLSEQPKFSPDDPQIDFTLRAYTRCCQSLGEDFIPLLPLAMKPLLDAITQDFTIDTQPFTDGYVQDIIDETSSHTLNNKALALYLLSIYLIELKRHCFPYLANMIEPIKSLLKFYYNEEVRTNAANLIPLIFRVIKDHFDAIQPDQTTVQLQNVFPSLYLPLVESTVNDEDQIEVLAAKVKNIGECLEIIGPLNNPDLIKKTCEAFKELFKSFKTFEEIINEDQDDDDADAEEHFEMETLNEAFTDLAVAVGDFVIANKANAVPYLKESLLQIVFEHLEKSNPDIQSSMLCILIDIIGNCEQAGVELYPHFIPTILQHINNDNLAIKQTAANGLGIAAEHGGSAFLPYLNDSLLALNNIMTNFDQSKEKDSNIIECAENAVAAVGKIARHFHTQLAAHMTTIIPAWLKFIPVTDKVEYPSTVNSYLFFLEKYQDLVTGPNCENIPILLRLIISGEKMEVMEPEQRTKLTVILKALHSRNILAPFYSSFQEDQEILSKYLQ